MSDEENLEDIDEEMIDEVMNVISTDGYSKSFIKDSDFLKVGPDFLELLDNEGIPAVQDNLKKWLDETSTLGSGDDITLGIIYHER